MLNKKHITVLFFCCFMLSTLFQGCGEGYKIIDEGYSVLGVGVVSDTTAVLAVRYFEQYEDDCCYPGGRADGYNYKGWGLKLVDVRYHHIYWEATTKDQGDFFATQLTDSTMCFIRTSLQGNVLLWLWKAGQDHLAHYQLTWVSEPIDFKSLKPWKDGLLIASGELWSYFNKPLVLIDTARGTIKRFYPDGVDSWILSCEDVKWNHLGGLCLKRMNDTCDYSLLLEDKKTLGNISYKQECPDGYVSFYGDFFGLQNNTFIMNNPYPSKDANVGLFRVFVTGSIAEQPSFWINNSRDGFLDSLGNVVGY